MNMCRAPAEHPSDRFCSPSAHPNIFPPSPTDSNFEPWRSPPHSCELTTHGFITSSYCQDPSFLPDARAKSTPPCDHLRPVHQIYPSPPLTDAALASTVPLPVLSGEPSEARCCWPDRGEIVDENMSHDGVRHIAPLSPPPTLLVETKDLPSSGWDKGMEHVVESWTYGDDLEDGGAPAPPFPPVRDDSGFEEFDAQEGFDDSRKVGGSYGEHVMIEPTAIWSPHSPLSIHEDLPLTDLPLLHGGVPNSGRHDSLFQSMVFSQPPKHPGRWGSESEMNWPASPSNTVFDDLPPSPKPSALSLDLPSFCSPLEFHPHGSSRQSHSLISPLDFSYHQPEHGWYSDEGFGDSSAHATVEQPHSFFTSFNHFPIHPPSDDVDLESDYSDTIMPSEDEDSMQTLPLSSPRRRTLNDLHEATPPHGDLCLTPAPHSPLGGQLSVSEDLDMEDPSEAPESPHSPNLLLPELEDEEMQPSTELHVPPVETISPSLLGGAPAPEQEGLGLFLQTLSVDPPFARSPSPDDDDLQFPDVQLDPASTNLEVDEFLQLRALRKHALQQERAARLAESELNDRVTAAAAALLPPVERAPSGSQPSELDFMERRARKRELHTAMDMRAEARRVRKQQKRRSKEIGALLDLKMQAPVSPMQGIPPLMGGGKAWTRSLAHLVANMVLRRHDRSRPLENRTPFDPAMRRKSYLHHSLSADDLLVMGADNGDAGGANVDCAMEE
ncbi:hypothetical protein BC628DRAFT_1381907 [Trametes gibbosa]|nr:hypothetical protein BC628DRAFT_1381907 [Trametes gibbosa]